MKKLLIALLIAAVSSGVYAYNVKCQFDNSTAYFLGYESVGSQMMAKYKCNLNGHVFYVRA